MILSSYVFTDRTVCIAFELEKNKRCALDIWIEMFTFIK